MEPRVIVVILSVLVLIDVIVGDEECPANTAPEQIIEVIECSGSCFEVVKPILEHFRELKTAADKSNDLKNKLMEVQKEVKAKDEQIKTLIKSNDAHVRAQSDIKELIRIINSEIDKKNNEIINKDTLIGSLNKQLSEKKEKLQSCVENINKTILLEKEKEIHENKEENKSNEQLNNKKDEVIQKKTDHAKSKDGKTYTFRPATGQGNYHIKLSGLGPFEAPCNGSGWMIIQRRMDGSVDFNRNWTEYRDGFGNLTGEFFIGLEKLHLMTQSTQHQLFIRLGKVDGSTDFVIYDDFKIGGEESSYLLESVGNHTGLAGDSFRKNKNRKFSTFDRDNDLHKNNCADVMGGWWLNQCGFSSLNGNFYKDGKMKDDLYGIMWGSWHNYDFSVSLTFVEMMIRPKIFKEL